MTKQDSKQNTIKRQFLQYIIPSIASMWFFSLYTMVDGAFVGRGVGPDALAAVNLSMPYISVIFCLAIMVSVGASNIISFHLGRKEEEIAEQVFTQSLLLILAIGLIVAGLSLLTIHGLTRLLGASEELKPYVIDYLKYIIPFSPFFMMSYTLEVLVKADGHPNLAVVFVFLSALTNIFLDYLLVIRFDYGVSGAAIATGLAQLVATLGYLSHFLSSRSNLKFTRPKFSFRRSLQAIQLGLPESLTEFSIGFTTFAFNFTILRVMGSKEVASFSVIMYIFNLVLNTMIAINQGSQPLVSYYYGRKNKSYMLKILSMMIQACLGMGFFFFLLVNLFTTPLVSLFLSPKADYIFSLSVKGLRIFSLSFLLVGLNVVFSGFLTASHSPRYGFSISIFRGYIAISLSLLLLPLIFGPNGVWAATIASELLTLVLSTFFLKNRLARL